MNSNDISKKIERQFDFLRPMVAIFIALLIAFLFILFSSEEPLKALSSFVFGPLSTKRRFGNVIEMLIPFLFTGSAVCIMFSANQINMASEGAFFLGAVTASFVAIEFTLPLGLHPFVAILLGGTVGAVVCSIPAILEVKWNAKVVVSSLMLNYICLYFGLYIINYILRDPMAGFMASEKFATTSILPKFMKGTNLHVGLFIALIVTILSYLFLYKSKHGYAIRVVGKNQNFAKYSGMKVTAIILYSQIIGGFISGMGGATQMLGMYNRFQYQQLPQYGFDGILIAILAKFNPKYIPLTGLFLAYIRTGAEIMARTSDVPVEIVQVVQAVIILLIAAQLFLEKWKHRKIVAASKKQQG